MSLGVDARIEQVVTFRGHPNVRGWHRTTLEVTKDSYLTPMGDCIIGVEADKGVADLHPRLKKGLARNDFVVKVEIVVGSNSVSCHARGHNSLSLTDKRSIILRKSSYTCPRTLAIRSSMAAVDLPREMIEKLKDQRTTGVMKIAIEENLM